jgi:hypothetical protein
VGGGYENLELEKRRTGEKEKRRRIRNNGISMRVANSLHATASQ